MGSNNLQIILIILIISGIKVSLTLKFEPSEDEGVQFGEFVKNTQYVSVDENNDASSVTFVKLTEVTSELTMLQMSGDEIISAKLNKYENIYKIEGLRVDYEKLATTSRKFLFKITHGDEIYMLVITINNIDDESPTLIARTCTMKEHTTLDVTNSNCKFTVSDPDGFLNKMNFAKIIGSNDEDQIFDFKFKEDPIDLTTSTEVYLVLKENVQLNYNDVALHTFNVYAKDGCGHPTIPSDSVQVIVKVEDVADEIPVWITFNSLQRITEGTAATFEIKARDGDLGIDNPINYKLQDAPEYVRIKDQSKGEITVDNTIDRESTNGQIHFKVIAFEVPDPTSQLISDVIIIIDDIDDNIPEIFIGDTGTKEISLEMDENSISWPEMPGKEITVKDIDLGENAMYTVTLRKFGKIDYTTAFQAIPSKGYETTTITINIKDPKMLDFENEQWRSITFELYTEGTVTTENCDKISINITLKDLNDESPVFEKSEFIVNVPENWGKGVPLPEITIKATDKDAEDIVKGVQHSIVGSSNNILQIEKLGGEIITLKENAFDFEKQTEILVQILAVDNNNHQAMAQLTINVQDVNDEDPRLLVSSTMRIDENRDNGYIIKSQITANDPDTDADLEFFILWNESYAMKDSSIISNANFSKFHCIHVKTVKIDTNNANAELSIIETEKNNTPDYEIFDSLYIYLVVQDKNQKYIGTGRDAATIVITINNLNDNKPIFTNADFPRSVTENMETGTYIGVITATDADLNRIWYSMQSTDADTPNWIGIDSSTGNLYVTLKEGEILDCDKPIRNSLQYTIVASDGDYSIPVNICIEIIDQNDCIPTIEGNQFITIFEDNQLTGETQGGTEIFTLKLNDDDRDEPYKTVECILATENDKNITSRFLVENNIIARLPDAKLNREEIDHFKILLSCSDNHNPTKGNVIHTISSTFTLFLSDVNDNIPQIISPKSISTNENVEIGPFPQVIQGKDDDLDKNGEIVFTIKKIERFIESAEADVPNDLFTISKTVNKQAQINVIKSLKGYYGTINLTIETRDEGTSPLYQNNTVLIEVAKYNFEEPAFIFPVDGETYYLATEQKPHTTLVKSNNERLENLEATDKQGDKFDINFEIIGPSENFAFIVVNNLGSKGELQLSGDNYDVEKIYSLTITAFLDDNSEISPVAARKNCTITIQFFDLQSNPFFMLHTLNLKFTENSTTESSSIPPATYGHDIHLDLDIYYLLNDRDDKTFNVNIKDGNITLNKALDYEEQQEHTIIILSLNSKSIPSSVGEKSKLNVTINVIDVNDETPVFDEEIYFATISVNSQDTKRNVLQLTATDRDTNSRLNYSIESVNGSNTELNEIKPFKIDNNTGQIIFLGGLKSTMHGFFTLVAKVEDNPPERHSTTTTFNIFLVGNNNTVNFKFGNTISVINSPTVLAKIRNVLNAEFGYESYTEIPEKDSDLPDQRTIVPMYFVDVNLKEPVEASAIIKNVTDTSVFVKLRDQLSQKASVNLLSFEISSNTTENLEDTLRTWLIGVSVVLVAFCLILIIAFVLKTRALNQRLRNLSTTKFGSQESGLNRQGIAVPTANKHTVEGSNPIYNNDDTQNIERISVASAGSADSELIGVEDNANFDYDPNPKKIDDIIF